MEYIRGNKLRPIKKSAILWQKWILAQNADSIHSLLEWIEFTSIPLLSLEINNSSTSHLNTDVPLEQIHCSAVSLEQVGNFS